MQRYATVAALVLALAFPLAGPESYYLSFASRVMIYALAATSLNLVLGYGGMVSFGHAAFIGAGAYVSSILLAEGVASAWIGWPAAVAASALAALAIGAVSLRTRGVYFIMITLAFAQMAYFLVNSMKVYGGDEGLTLPARASTGLGVDLGSDVAFYYVALAALAFAVYGLHHALTEGPERALIADLATDDARGRAFGLYHAVTGVVLLPASLLAGALWQGWSPAVALLAGAGFALAAAFALLVAVPEPARLRS